MAVMRWSSLCVRLARDLLSGPEPHRTIFLDPAAEIETTSFRPDGTGSPSRLPPLVARIPGTTSEPETRLDRVVPEHLHGIQRVFVEVLAHQRELLEQVVGHG